MLPESFPARGEHLSQQWPLLESLDLSSFEPGKTLTSAVVAELTSGAKQLVNTHIEEDVTISAEENLKRVLKCAKILQFAFELEQYQAEEVEQDLERKVDALANDLQEAENDCEELRMQVRNQRQRLRFPPRGLFSSAALTPGHLSLPLSVSLSCPFADRQERRGGRGHHEPEDRAGFERARGGAREERQDGSRDQEAGEAA